MSQIPSPPHGATTATQRALGIAEIVGNIISFLPQEYFEPETDLISSALVNKFWLAEALPVIWKKLYPHPMEHMFAALKPDRRQFYANFVVSGTTRVFDEREPGPEDTPCDLRGIMFPKMTELRMFVITQYGETSLPDLNCPNLRRMIFEDWDGIKDTVSERLGADDGNRYFGISHWNLKILLKRHPNLCDSLGHPKVRWITKFLPSGAGESEGYGFEDLYDYPVESNTDSSISE
ncbi:hypothetical protein N7536_006304 [Penicillium majusculum]|nr:hypothetical protein N7536_006304 [Penicillium majusculum]